MLERVDSAELATDIRLRAERKAGQLLKEMAEKGEREMGGGATWHGDWIEGLERPSMFRFETGIGRRRSLSGTLSCPASLYPSIPISHRPGLNLHVARPIEPCAA